VASRASISIALCTDFAAASQREWLVTNGLGGYAAGTLTATLTRRYHGLLVAALQPPLGRTVLVAAADASVRYRGQTHALATHQYADGTIEPQGFRHLESFTLNGGLPVWTWTLGDARLVQTVWMAPGANVTYVRWQLAGASAPLGFEVAPLCTCRDHHGTLRGGGTWQVELAASTVRLSAWPGAPAIQLACPGATFRDERAWWWNFRQRVEAERGLDAEQDLFRPGVFSAELQSGQELTLIIATGDEPPPAAAVARAGDQQRRARLLGAVPREPGWVRQLVLAADQFLVRRAVGARPDGVSVIAGYPWFGDWGRDTMIALPGLALVTGQPELAEQCLRTFAAHLHEGLLPNRFPEHGRPPEYNTVDATLWFFQALDAHRRASGALNLIRELRPKLVECIDWHLLGTAHGIGVDPADGLLRAGEPGVQLTWMDARVGDRVVTPRHGKPVEINALWHAALLLMAEWAQALGTSDTRRYLELALGVRDAFRRRYWNAARGCLFDVVDGPGGGDDPALRPNQILAVSLGADLLEPAMAAAVVEACQAELLTPVGLRSLGPAEPGYLGVCTGGPAERDAAYHQGTVWAWLLGPFALAHARVHGRPAEARALLAGIGSHLAEDCVGTIGEIFDGDAPHRPRGCFAQAWSVAEILRAWRALGTLLS
jgi:predicted glycogen debranching enzyme